jgi:hypothetical protein
MQPVKKRMIKGDNPMKTIITLLSLFIALTITKAVDFNGDGNADYVLYNQATRQTGIWYLHNNIFISGAYGPTLPAGWSLITEADFNGDGKPDYFLFNTSSHQTAIWYMNNNVRTGAAYGPTAANGWIPTTVADFNGDGKPDIVVFNSATNQTAVWYMNNNIYTGEGYGPTIADGYLLVSAAGDFNGDGHPDYLLYNPITRRSAIWFLNNRTFLGGVYGPTLPAGYTLDELADFNHDGADLVERPDYLLNLGQVTALWYLSGNILLGGAYGPTIAPGWSLAAATAKLCVFGISPHNVAIPVGGDSVGRNIYVSTLQFGCTWTTTANVPWIHITHGSAYVGSGYATYTVDACDVNYPCPRTGYITIADGLIFTVNQAGTAYGSIVITSQTWTPNGDGTYEVVVTGTASIAANLEADLFTYPANSTCGTWISTSWPTDHRSLNDPATTTWTFCFHYAGNYQPYVLLRTNVGNVVYDYYVYPHL